MLGNNSPYSPWMMFYFLREDALPDLIDVSGRMAQMTQLYHDIVSVQVDIR